MALPHWARWTILIVGNRRYQWVPSCARDFTGAEGACQLPPVAHLHVPDGRYGLVFWMPPPIKPASESNRPPILVFAPENPLGRLALASEIGPDRFGARPEDEDDFMFEMHGVNGETTAAYGLIASGSRPGQFGRFAAAVFRSQNGGKTPPPPMDEEEVDPSIRDPWAYQLASPKLSARLGERHGVQAGSRSAIITAEAPPLEMVIEHAAEGTSVVRYTDQEALAQLRAPLTGPVLPNDIAMPDLARLPFSRGWPRRGLDARRLAEQLPIQRSDKLETRDLEFRSTVRKLRTAIDGLEPATIVVPTTAAEKAAERGDDLARAFMARERSDRRHTTMSMMLHWHAPTGEAERFVLPLMTSRLTVGRLGHEEIAGPQLIVVDGDIAVPWTLTSRVFEIWVRATCPVIGGRFRLSTGTIETFPLPSFVEILPGSTDRAPSLVCLHEDLRRLAARSDEQVWRARPIGYSSRDQVLFHSELEEALFDGYGLSPEASDVQILDRLVTMNLGFSR